MSAAALFHVIIRDDRAGVDTLLTRDACTHDEACTILRKQSDRALRGMPAHKRAMVCPVAEVKS